LSKVVAVAAVAVLVASLTSMAAAQSDDLRALRASAPKEDTNVKGVKIFAGPPAGFDALKATDRELALYGLPPRPDQASKPKEFMLWQRAMGAAKHRAAAKFDVKSFSSTNFKPSKLSGASQTSTGSYNWSGVASTNKNKKWNSKTSFDEVVSIFNVPVAQPPFGACGAGITGPFYEVSWNGIGGFYSYDSLVQGGSLSAADCSGDTLYEAWVEWYPSYSIIGVFYVNPGDDIFVVSFGAPGTDDQVVFVEDITLGVYAEVDLPYVTGNGSSVPAATGMASRFRWPTPSTTSSTTTWLSTRSRRSIPVPRPRATTTSPWLMILIPSTSKVCMTGTRENKDCRASGSTPRAAPFPVVALPTSVTAV
jgi:hypothetical protein